MNGPRRHGARPDPVIVGDADELPAPEEIRSVKLILRIETSTRTLEREFKSPRELASTVNDLFHTGRTIEQIVNALSKLRR